MKTLNKNPKKKRFVFSKNCPKSVINQSNGIMQKGFLQAFVLKRSQKLFEPKPKLSNFFRKIFWFVLRGIVSELFWFLFLKQISRNNHSNSSVFLKLTCYFEPKSAIKSLTNCSYRTKKYFSTFYPIHCVFTYF